MTTRRLPLLAGCCLHPHFVCHLQWVVEESMLLGEIVGALILVKAYVPKIVKQLKICRAASLLSCVPSWEFQYCKVRAKDQQRYPFSNSGPNFCLIRILLK